MLYLEYMKKKNVAPQKNIAKVKEIKKEKLVAQKEFHEFVAFVKDKFLANEKKLGSLDIKMNYLDIQLSAVEVKVDAGFGKVLTLLDKISKRLDDKTQEDAAQFNLNKRHHTWIKELAKHTHYKLSKEA